MKSIDLAASRSLLADLAGELAELNKCKKLQDCLLKQTTCKCLYFVMLVFPVFCSSDLDLGANWAKIKWPPHRAALLPTPKVKVMTLTSMYDLDPDIAKTYCIAKVSSLRLCKLEQKQDGQIQTDRCDQNYYYTAFVVDIDSYNGCIHV